MNPVDATAPRIETIRRAADPIVDQRTADRLYFDGDAFARGRITLMLSGSSRDAVVREIQKVAERLTDTYPLITIDEDIFGEPRLAEHRFGVSDVLSALCVFGSFEKMIEKHGGRYTEQELKDAVRFARDFLDAFYTSNEDDA